MIFEFVKIDQRAFDALCFANAFRHKMGMERLNDLPKGTRHAESCPMAKACNHHLSFGKDRINEWGAVDERIQQTLIDCGWGPHGEHPAAVTRFIFAHDGREIEEYYS